jgi:flagellar hook-length control protein FliK
MNLPISTHVPQASAAKAAASSAPTSDDQAAQAADPFGNVLARQLADGSATTDSATSLKASVEDSLTAGSNKKNNKGQAGDPAPTADMLAALLTAPVAQAAAKPAAAALPTGNTHTQTIQLDGGKAMSGLPTATTVQPGIQHAVDNKNQNFAATLNAVDSKEQRAALQNTLQETMQHKNQPPQPDILQQATASTLSQIAQTNPLAGNNANAAARLAVDTPVSSPSWGNDFGQKITWLSTQHQQSAELHLNPPDLGPLNVVLHVSGDQATAMFTSPHAAVRDAVEQAMPRLREMMADNGIMLGNATVSDQAPRDNQAGQSPGQRGSAGTFGGNTGEISALSQGSRTVPASRHNGLVDTFA